MPWYRSAPVCLVAVLLLAAVIFLGAAGIHAAAVNAQYHQHIWMPVLLVCCAGILLLAILFRLIRRRWSDS